MHGKKADGLLLFVPWSGYDLWHLLGFPIWKLSCGWELNLALSAEPGNQNPGNADAGPFPKSQPGPPAGAAKLCPPESAGWGGHRWCWGRLWLPQAASRQMWSWPPAGSHLIPTYEWGRVMVKFLICPLTQGCRHAGLCLREQRPGRDICSLTWPRTLPDLSASQPCCNSFSREGPVLRGSASKVHELNFPSSWDIPSCISAATALSVSLSRPQMEGIDPSWVSTQARYAHSIRRTLWGVCDPSHPPAKGPRVISSKGHSKALCHLLCVLRNLQTWRQRKRELDIIIVGWLEFHKSISLGVLPPGSRGELSLVPWQGRGALVKILMWKTLTVGELHVPQKKTPSSYLERAASGAPRACLCLCWPCPRFWELWPQSSAQSQLIFKKKKKFF